MLPTCVIFSALKLFLKKISPVEWAFLKKFVNKNAIKRGFFNFWFLALFERVFCALFLYLALIQALFDPFFVLFGV